MQCSLEGSVRMRCVRWGLLALVGVLLLGLPGCASKGPGAPIFFGRTPMGSVTERPIEGVKLGDHQDEDDAPETNYSGRSKPTKLAYKGKDVPDRWPLKNECEVLSRFGPRGRRGKLHAGFDIRAKMRTPVYSTADGLVVAAENGGAYGKVLVVDHGGGISSVYSHLDERQAQVGQEVKAGEQIALSGRSGNATTPHLHYEIRINGRPVSPEKYLPGAKR